MSLETELESFCRRIAGRLYTVDGPFRDKRGLKWALVHQQDYVRWFRSWEKANAAKEKLNQSIA